MQKILRLFSAYVNPFEKKADKFLRNLNSKSSKHRTQVKLLELMQENAAILTLWLEKKSKNYRRLSKKYRRQRYANLLTIEKLLDEYQLNQNFPEGVFEKFSVNFNEEDLIKINYLWKIMNFCQSNFHYQESSSFDKLLVNPQEEKMVGDCNQITTLYAYLYSLKYPINDLEIKLFEDHVALYFKGIDIEATNGTFVKHKKQGQVLPILEIVSTNLLDIADFREKQKNITPQSFLKNAQLAFLLSSLREVVQHNLDVALQKLAISFAKEKKFSEASLFYEKISDAKIRLDTKGIYGNAAEFYVKRNNFRRAKYFAKKAKDKKIDDYILHNEAVYYLKNKNFVKARKAAIFLKNDDLLKSIIQNEYSHLAQTVKNVKTLDEAKKKKMTYQKLLKLAKESKNSELEKWPGQVLKQIK